MIKPISFKNSRNKRLQGVVYVPRKYDTAIVLLHGFPSQSTGKIEKLAKILRKLGYLTLRFDFSGVDMSEGRFEDKLMSREVKDIKYAIDTLAKKYPFKKLILYGHSTGAIDAALYAYQDERITKLILNGSECNLKRCVHNDFTLTQIKEFKIKKHITYHAPGRWFHQYKLNKAFYDEYFTLDVKGALKKFKKPILIIHGEKDELVPLREGIETYNCANNPKKLVIIKNADHRLRGIIPKIKLLWHMYRFIKHDPKD